LSCIPLFSKGISPRASVGAGIFLGGNQKVPRNILMNVCPGLLEWQYTLGIISLDTFWNISFVKRDNKKNQNFFICKIPRQKSTFALGG